MLTVTETTSLFSQHKIHTWENGPPPLSRLAAERKKKRRKKKKIGRTELNQHHSQQQEHGRYGRYCTLSIRLHQPVKLTDLSSYCHCSDRYPAPLVAHTSLTCAKHMTNSGSIRGGCSINYVQFIKLHL